MTKEADEALVALKARRAVWGELEQAAASEDHDVRHTDVSPEVGAAIVATYLELLKVDSNRDDGASPARQRQCFVARQRQCFPPAPPQRRAEPREETVELLHRRHGVVLLEQGCFHVVFLVSSPAFECSRFPVAAAPLCITQTPRGGGPVDGGRAPA